VIRDIRQLAGTAQDLVEADRQFAALQAQYSALPEFPRQLPEKLVEGIQRDYRNACRQFSDCRSRIINNLHGQRMQALKPWGNRPRKKHCGKSRRSGIP
jgi:prophage DNA circulation protein